MNRDNVSVFVPTRKNSERVANKNTRPFCGIEGGLLRLKLETLLKMTSVGEIVVSTNDESTIEVAESFRETRIRIDHRPEHLCLSETKVSDLIAHVPTVVSSDTIFWIHVTSPFLTAEDYENALSTFFDNLDSGKADSLLSVTKIQQFLWDDEERKMINWDIRGGNWPRTQDLKPVYEVNHAFYINTRANYLKYNNRVSPDLAVHVLDKIKAFDIDWEEDFLIAESIYEKLILPKQ